MRNSNKLVLAAITLAIASAASIASAQVQQIQQGRALDANNQVGSGGSNRPVQGYTPINGNEIISGNVAGLKYFHGDVQTRSTYEFGSGLGSSSFNNFIRQSAGDGPGAYSSGLGSIYYNPNSTVSRGITGFNPGAIGGGYDSRFIPRSAISPTSNLSFAPTGAGLPFRAFDRLNAAQNSAVIPTNEPGGAISSDQFSFRMTNNPNATPIDASVKSGKVDANKVDASNTNTNSNGGNTSPEQVTGNLANGSRINAGVESTPLATERTEMRISDTYKSLLDDLKQAQEAAAKAGTATDNNTAPKAVNDPTAIGGDNTRLPSLEIDPLTGQPRTVRSAADLAKAGIQTGNPSMPGYVSKTAIATLESQPDSTLKAGQKVKPIESLAGNAEAASTNFGKLMKSGEALMAEGRYLEAADTYQSALLAQPNDALAILGRAHAELGAGMYESSAADLKYLFTRKPELISVRYDLAKHLPPERQEYLLKDLLVLAQKKPAGNTASFLYCYLCYQTQHPYDLNDELGRWSVRAWKDSWYDITKRAWTK